MPPVFTKWTDLKKQVRRIGWLLLGFALFQFGVGYLTAKIYPFFSIDINIYKGIRLVLLTLLTTGGTVLMGKHVLKVHWEKETFRLDFSFVQLLQTVASMCTITFTLSIVLTLVQQALGIHFMESGLNDSNHPIYILLMVIAAVGIGPCCEELLFRGEIEQSLLPYGGLFAAVLSGILFGWMHMNFLQGIMHMFTGTLLGLIYWKYRNLTFNICCHMTYNAISVGLSYMDRWMYLRGMLVLALMIYGIVGLLSLRPLPEKSSYPLLKMSLKQIPILLFFVLFIGFSIYSIVG